MKRFLIDGFNLAFRAHYAFSSLITKTGLYSGCIYGFLNTLKSLRSKYPDFKFNIAWDNYAAKKRELFAAYKANRNSFNLDVHILDLKEALSSVNIDQYESPGEEADDVIATIAHHAEDLVYIYSSDKDLLQLVVDGKVICIRPKVGATAERVYDEEAVFNEFGIKPADLSCYLALRGDTSDNVPGVPRLPSKIIVALCNEYHEPSIIYQNINKEKLTDFQRKSIVASEDQVGINYKLVKLDKNVDLKSRYGSSDVEKFQGILDKYEIKSISSNTYISLFQKETAFLRRTQPALKLHSLFED